MGLTEHECEARREKRMTRFLKDSKLPLEKTLASFDRKRLPQKVDAQLNVLIDGSFLDRSENILAFGNPGSGKNTSFVCHRSGTDLKRTKRSYSDHAVCWYRKC